MDRVSELMLKRDEKFYRQTNAAYVNAQDTQAGRFFRAENRNNADKRNVDT